MPRQIFITLPPKSQGIHLITDDIVSRLGQLPPMGLLHVFVQHTSCALCVNENYDPDVRADMEKILHRLVPESQPYYQHTLEGPDDMPAHAKAALLGSGLTLPITNGRLNLGAWQGIYLCEFRRNGGPRKLVATVMP